VIGVEPKAFNADLEYFNAGKRLNAEVAKEQRQEPRRRAGGQDRGLERLKARGYEA